MSALVSRTRLMALLVLLLFSPGRVPGQTPVGPSGTEPLTLEGDLASRMVEGLEIGRAHV